MQEIWKNWLIEETAIIIPGKGKEFIPRFFKGKIDLHQRAYTIFDFYNDHLASNETHTEEAPNKWNYIKTDGKVGNIYGDIVTGYDTVAMEDEGILFGRCVRSSY